MSNLSEFLDILTW